jgi:predicted metal-dependent hydrolase
VQLDFLPERAGSQGVAEAPLYDPPMIQFRFVRNPKAKRYILRLDHDGVGRVTIPRFGSRTAAEEFAELNKGWLQRQRLKRASPVKENVGLVAGSSILLRGQMETIRLEQEGLKCNVCIGSEIIELPRGLDGARLCSSEEPAAATSNETTVKTPPGSSIDLRVPIEKHLWMRAMEFFRDRVFELAASKGFTVRRVAVRNQRTRWGSCSRLGTISLNWRLIQTPPSVQDYIILHELAHLREMNHSRRFWREVEALCPNFRAAESWLKSNSNLMRH